MTPIEPGSDSFREAYNEGREARRLGLNEDDNPYPPSGHERDTTFMDEMHYHWYCGWNATDDEGIDK